MPFTLAGVALCLLRPCMFLRLGRLWLGITLADNLDYSSITRQTFLFKRERKKKSF